MAQRSDDGDPTVPPDAGSSAAFAATIAPGPTAPPMPVPAPVSSAVLTAPRASSSLDAETTLDAPTSGEGPALPVVSAGYYRPEREIARGGMGRIVAAEDLRLGRAVALKELIDPGNEQRGRFQREALITARLQHPGIVPVYEAGRWPSGDPFFAMKLVSGRPLDRVIADARTLEDRLALLPRIAAATDAIAYAHSQRVIHRDLKPANVLIGEFGETVVIDWGLAKSLDDVDAPESLRPVARRGKLPLPAPEDSVERGPSAPGAARGSGGPDGARGPGGRSAKTAQGGENDPSGPSGPGGRSAETAQGGENDPSGPSGPGGQSAEAVQSGENDPSGPSGQSTKAARPGASGPSGPNAASGQSTRAARPGASGPSGPSAASAQGGSRASNASTLTVAGAVMGTPAYMAPEQARGEPVDQRADVFALGAMLYHLLAGAPPYNARTATEVIAAAALGKVRPLAAREPGAPTDLVAIVERAMAPGPADRYSDAGELATELRRFLTGQLVSAHRYTAGERVGRFVRRHRAAVTIAMLAAIGFAAGGTFAVRRIMHERDVADHERQLADARRRAAEQLIDTMLSDVKDRLQQIGRIDLLASLGIEIRDYYGTLANIPGGMPSGDVDRMASAVELLGVAERDSGKLDQALATFSEARATLARTAGERAGERARFGRQMIARLDYEIGTIHQQRGAVDEALRWYHQAKTELDALLGESPTERSVLLGAADTRDRLGDLLRNQGKVDQALNEYTEAKAERERAVDGTGKRSPEEILALSTSHLKLGSVFQVRGESARALDDYRAAHRLRDDLARSQRDDAELQKALLDADLPLGDMLRQVGDPRSAIETYDKALPAMDALTRHDPDNTTWQRLRGNFEADFGFALLDAGDYRAGLTQLEAAIATQQNLVVRDPKSTIWLGDLSRSYTRAGDAELYLGELDRSIAEYQRALEIRRGLVAKDPRSAPYRRSMAFSFTKLANAYTYKADLPRAIEAHEQALALRTALVRESPGQGGYRNELASTEAALGKLIATSDPGRSKQLLDAAITRARALVLADPINNDFRETLPQTLLAEADAARAAHDARRATAALTEALSQARSGADHAPHDVHWPGLLAEIHAGFAELAAARGDVPGATAAWQAVRDVLEPLAKAGRLSAQRKPLLDRARAGR